MPVQPADNSFSMDRKPFNEGRQEIHLSSIPANNQTPDSSFTHPGFPSKTWVRIAANAMR